MARGTDQVTYPPDTRPYDYLASTSSSGSDEVDGEEMEGVRSAIAHGIGPAITWYTAYNIFATGGIHASWLIRDEMRDTGMIDFLGNPILEEVSTTSKTGIGVSATVGKEWWLTESWGLGVAARFHLASMPDSESDDSTWGVHSFALLASTTVN